MDARELEHMARRLLGGETSLDQFVQEATNAGIADLGEAQIDLDRRRRCGFPEVVFGEGKSDQALLKTFRALLDSGVDVLATRISPDQAAALEPSFPEGRYNPVGRTYRVARQAPPGDSPRSRPTGLVTIVTAGTSDLPVAEEARETLDWMGVGWRLVQDVGVAGPQRLQRALPQLVDADAIVVVAGMEAALPSVVGGHVACPVIGVPTSVGYGASLGGIAALLGMLNSCASNVTVVNIDAGFKGAYVAGLIATRAAKRAGVTP